MHVRWNRRTATRECTHNNNNHNHIATTIVSRTPRSVVVWKIIAQRINENNIRTDWIESFRRKRVPSFPFLNCTLFEHQMERLKRIRFDNRVFSDSGLLPQLGFVFRSFRRNFRYSRTLSSTFVDLGISRLFRLAYRCPPPQQVLLHAWPDSLCYLRRSQTRRLLHSIPVCRRFLPSHALPHHWLSSGQTLFSTSFFQTRLTFFGPTWRCDKVTYDTNRHCVPRFPESIAYIFTIENHIFYCFYQDCYFINSNNVYVT